MVILAEGVNGLLSQKAGVKKELKPAEVAVGIKEIIELPSSVINDRFHVEDGEGAARLFVGAPTLGLIGGGFLYTNKESLSLGLVFNVGGLAGSPHNIPDLLEDFKQHPVIRPLIAGGKSVEYAAHLVPEAGLSMLPVLFADRLLVVGDAAGLVVNSGYTVRGMDLALASGQAAAETVIEARRQNDFSRSTLARYREKLEESFVLKDLRCYSRAPQFLETRRLYDTYPRLAEAVCREMFGVGGSPARPLARGWPHVKRAGLLNLVKDLWKGRQAL